MGRGGGQFLEYYHPVLTNTLTSDAGEGGNGHQKPVTSTLSAEAVGLLSEKPAVHSAASRTVEPPP